MTIRIPESPLNGSCRPDPTSGRPANFEEKAL